MKILMLWHDYPSVYTGGALPALNVIKHLSKKNEVTLLCFTQATKKSKQVPSVEQYCEVIETVDIHIPRSRPYAILYAIKNTFSFQNLLAKNRCLFTPNSPTEIRRKLEGVLIQKKIDLIYSDLAMAYLVQHIKLPKIVHALDCWTEAYYGWYKNTQRLMLKFFWGLTYLRMKIYEPFIYKKFDACIVVTHHEKDAIRSLLPEIDIRVIPNGVDCEYFKPWDEETRTPSIVFIGGMSDPPNVDAVLYFYKYIYGHIKKNVPGVKFYIVGQKPTKEVQQLTSDETVIVTGYVEDVRPYLAKSSVVVVPMISGRGIKNKVLEAMAMEKPVVSTSLGARGINVTPRENIIIADEPMVFAQQLVELLNNEQLRRRIAYNARKLVKNQYSWEKTADTLNKLFEEKQSKYANK